MNAIFKKLNFKEQPSIVVMNAPESFAQDLQEMATLTKVVATISPGEIHFFLGFVTRQQEVDAFVEKVIPRLTEDGIFWFAYPKGSSKKFTCEFNRDSGWTALGKYDFEPVRMVAIDEDWSALRFRHADKIKVMTRSKALSEAGNKKIKPSKEQRGTSSSGKALTIKKARSK